MADFKFVKPSWNIYAVRNIKAYRGGLWEFKFVQTHIPQIVLYILHEPIAIAPVDRTIKIDDETKGRWYWDRYFYYFIIQLNCENISDAIALGWWEEGAFFYLESWVKDEWSIYSSATRYRGVGFDEVQPIPETAGNPDSLNKNPWGVNPSHTALGISLAQGANSLAERLKETPFYAPYLQVIDEYFERKTYFGLFIDESRVIASAWAYGFTDPAAPKEDNLWAYNTVVACFTRNRLLYVGTVNDEDFPDCTDQEAYPSGYGVVRGEALFPLLPWGEFEWREYELAVELPERNARPSKVYSFRFDPKTGRNATYAAFPLCIGDENFNVETGGPFGVFEFPYRELPNTTDTTRKFHNFPMGVSSSFLIFPIKNAAGTLAYSAEQLAKKIAVQTDVDSNLACHLPLYQMMSGFTSTNLSTYEQLIGAKKSFWHTPQLPAGYTQPQALWDLLSTNTVFLQSLVFRGPNVNLAWTFPWADFNVTPAVWGMSLVT